VTAVPVGRSPTIDRGNSGDSEVRGLGRSGQ
jgi:hypothetical protein